MSQIWKDIPGYDGHYQVSNDGVVRSLDRRVLAGGNQFQKANGSHTRFAKGRILSQQTNKHGYIKVILCADGKMKTFVVHRLMAISFIPNHESKREVNHINGINSDNRIDNLEWNTSSENQIHAFRMGLQKSSKGDKHGRRKLNSMDVQIIREASAAGFKDAQIAKYFNVSFQNISKIRLNQLWK